MKANKNKSEKNDKKDNILVSKTEPDVTTRNSGASGFNNRSGASSVRKRRSRNKSRPKESIVSNAVNLTSNYANNSLPYQLHNPHLNFNYYNPFANTGFLQSLGYYDFASPSPYSQCAPQFQYNQTTAMSMVHNSFKEVCMFRGETSSSMGMSTNADGNERTSENCNRMGQNQQGLSKIRNWQWTSLGKRLKSVNQEPPGLVFTLMNYNVLSQTLLNNHHYLYLKHNQKALVWKQRWENLLCEITNHDADILCLQEVEESHIEKYYNTLKKLGYESIYKRRSPSLADGCAIYYKSSVFTLKEYSTVEYYQNNIQVLDRNNVAIVARFAPKDDPENEFVVATTHLLYNPNRQDVRLAQTQVLLSEVDRLAYKVNNRGLGSNYLPIIVTGDFNSEPQSAVLELITTGKVEYGRLQNRTLSRMRVTSPAGRKLVDPSLRITDNCQHADLLPHRTAKANIPREQELEIITLKHSERNSPKRQSNANATNPTQHEFETGVLTHDLNLRSVHNWTSGNDTEGTTFQGEWITVDYIFYSNGTANVEGKKRDRLQLVAKYRVPTTKQLKRIKYIPNMEVGSDHLSLLAKFKLDYFKKKSHL